MDFFVCKLFVLQIKFFSLSVLLSGSATLEFMQSITVLGLTSSFANTQTQVLDDIWESKKETNAATLTVFKAT